MFTDQYAYMHLNLLWVKWLCDMKGFIYSNKMLQINQRSNSHDLINTPFPPTKYLDNSLIVKVVFSSKIHLGNLTKELHSLIDIWSCVIDKIIYRLQKRVKLN